MAAAYTYLVLRASDGQPLEEIPATGVSFTEAITEDGSFSCTLPLHHAKAARSLIGPGYGREIAVIRNDSRCVFNGPIVSTQRSLSGKDVQISARTPFFYLSRRYTDGASRRNSLRDVFYIVRDLVAIATTGRSAPLYRHTVWPGTNSGWKVHYRLSSTTRLNIGEQIKAYADLEGERVGFDFRYDYGFERPSFVVSRTLHLAYPRLGVDLGNSRVMSADNGVTEVVDEEDITRAANRVHVLGAGPSKKRKRALQASASSLSAGIPLLERVIDRTMHTQQSWLNAAATVNLRRLLPPTRVMSATYRPTAALPYDFCALGDTVRVRINVGSEALDLRRRVVAMTTNVDDEGEEDVELTFNVPADEVVE